MPAGIASALAGALLWGLSGACVQMMLSAYGATPLFITAVRDAVAAVALLAFSAFRYRHELFEIATCGKSRWRLVLFGCGLFLSQSTFAASVMHTNAGTATVLQSLATVFVMVLACVLGRRLPRLTEGAGLIFALASVWLIATQGDPSSLSLAPSGLAWGVANALSVTLYLMIPAKLYARWPSIPVITCGLCVSAVVAFIAFGIESSTSGGLAFPALDAWGMLVLVIGVGLLGTACAFGLYLYGVAIIGSTRGSLLGTAEPASAMALTVFWLGTAMSPADWAGLVLMVAMVFLVALSAKGLHRER